MNAGQKFRRSLGLPLARRSCGVANSLMPWSSQRERESCGAEMPVRGSTSADFYGPTAERRKAETRQIVFDYCIFIFILCKALPPYAVTGVWLGKSGDAVALRFTAACVPVALCAVSAACCCLILASRSGYQRSDT